MPALSDSEKRLMDDIFARYRQKEFSVSPSQVCFDIGWLQGLVMRLAGDLDRR
jgi:hypothetical protein